MSEFVQHEPCPTCQAAGRDGKGNNLARYDDGHAVCFAFGCDHYEKGTGEGREDSSTRSPSSGKGKPITGLLTGEPAALGKRKISEETCRHLDYTVGEHHGRPVQIATYYNAQGQRCAQKLRFPDKTFRWVGDPKQALLYGQQRFKAGGRKVVITEGEIDALSVDEVQDRKWPVVSVPNGADSAKKACLAQLEWLDSFQEVVIFFDSDEPGKQAAVEVAELFGAGKAKIVNFEYKDANEALQKGDGAAVINATWNAVPYWPDDLVEGGTDALWERVRDFKIATDYEYPWAALNAVTLGMRLRELILWTAGSGIGKSHALREVSLGLLPALRAKGKKLGIVALEESVEITAIRLASMHLKISHTRWDDVPLEERKKAIKEVTHGIVLYDHFGSLGSERLFTKLRALAASGCDVIILDHISIVISGSDEGDTNERRMIDKMMTQLRSLSEEKNVIFHVISHLRKAGGTAHEEGGRITLDDLRGSGSLKQLSDSVIAIERNQQSEDEKLRHVAQLRVLKNRWVGTTGPAGWIKYDPETTRMTELVENPFKDEEDECGTSEDF